VQERPSLEEEAPEGEAGVELGFALRREEALGGRG
jgi:hypothetical protein